MDISPEKDSNSGGKQSTNITNITGPIQGPVFMGNERVSFGGTGGDGTSNRGVFTSTPFNADVPPLKPSATEIKTDDGVITVGGATLKYSSSTVSEAKKIAPTYKVDLSDGPADFTRASSLLTCTPAFSGRRHIEVTLPTFCSTNKSVTASVYRKNDEGQWQFVDETFLERDRQIFISVREISNMAAFIPKERVDDVEYSIACFLFNNADGQFVMGFCLDDEAIKAAFCHRIKSNGFRETVHIPDVLQTHLGDEIAFKISPGQVMPNTRMTIDENFVSGVEGFMSRCTLDKDAVKPKYFISPYRNGKEIDEYVYGVKPDESKSEGVGGGIQFMGTADIGNVISSVAYAEIDQRTYHDKSGAVKEDKVRYTGCDGCSEKKPNRSEEMPECKMKLGPTGSPERCGGIVFHGEPKIGNLVHNARHVRIDQRMMSGQTKRAPIERIVQARQQVHEDDKMNSFQKVSATVAASGDIGVRAEPISQDCEKKAEGNTTVHEGGSVEAEAKPIWDNCEQQSIEEKSVRSSDDSKEMELERNNRLTRRRKENQSMQISNMKPSSVPVANSDPSMKREHKGTVQSLDKAHIAMIIIAVILLGMISYVVISGR